MSKEGSFHLHFSNRGRSYNFNFLESEWATPNTVFISGRNFLVDGNPEQIQWIKSKFPEFGKKSSLTLEEIKNRLLLLDFDEIEISTISKTHSLGVESLVSQRPEPKFVAVETRNREREVGKVLQKQSKVENDFRPITQNPADISTVSITDRMKQLNIPGASIAVIEGGEIAWSKGYGNLEGSNKYSQVASISKTVNALTMISLIDKGQYPKLAKRGLDTDVREILGNELMDIMDPKGISKEEGQEITIRRLLSHTAGISTPIYPGYPCKTELKKEIAQLQNKLSQYEQLENKEQIIAKIEYLEKAYKIIDAFADLPTCEEILTNESNIFSEKVRVIGPPGKFWEYSGGGAEIIQRVIEVLTEKEYKTVVKELIFDRLEMKSKYSPEIDLRTNGHGRDGESIPGKWHEHPELAAAGLWSTALDLAKLAIAVQKSAFDPKDKRAIISSNLGKEMWTPLADTQEGKEQHGLGVFVKKSKHTTYAYHIGDNNGYRSVFFINEEGKGAAIVVPSENGDLLMKEAIASISNVYDWKDREGLLYIQSMFVSSDYDNEGAKQLFDRFHGEYHFLDPRSRDHTIIISGSNEQIQMIIDGDTTELVPISGNLGYFRTLGPISNQYSSRELRPPGLLPGQPEKAIFEEHLDGTKSITIFGHIKHIMK